jgi:hypothetical protein
VRQLLSLLLVLAAAAPAAAGAMPRLRGITPAETRIIDDLLARSRTARELLERIDATDVIVYVELRADTTSIRAATRFVSSAPGARFLRVVLGAMSTPLERAALLGHELQHVLEIALDPGVRDDAGLRRLYARIGEDRNARFAFETTAARDIAERVRRELGSAPAVVADARTARTRAPSDVQ